MDRNELYSSNAEKIEFVFRRSRPSRVERLPVIVLANLTNNRAASLCLKYSDRLEIQRLLNNVVERAPSVIFPVDPNPEFIEYVRKAFTECGPLIAESACDDSFHVLIIGDTEAFVVQHPIPWDLRAEPI